MLWLEKKRDVISWIRLRDWQSKVNFSQNPAMKPTNWVHRPEPGGHGTKWSDEVPGKLKFKDRVDSTLSNQDQVFWPEIEGSAVNRTRRFWIWDLAGPGLEILKIFGLRTDQNSEKADHNVPGPPKIQTSSRVRTIVWQPEFVWQ